MTRVALSSVVFTLAALTGAACVAGSAAPGEQPGAITGVIDYAGAEVGPLRVVAYASFPPSGPPVARVTIAEPRFPQPYELTGLAPGRYFVLAIIDTFDGDGDRYRPRVDPGGAFGRYDSPAAITLAGDRPALDVDIELAAPTPGSPWDR
jgi:uncharacterized protein (DUF2141 family)